MKETINGLALCAGIGSIELGIRIACPAYETVCFCERDSYAAATLCARMEDKAMAPAPIWDDIQSFDGRPWRGLVDIATAGLPCQPYSQAGKRRGWKDPRCHKVLPHVIRILRECRPPLVFFENVPAWVIAGHFRRFGEELSRLGYEITDPLFLGAKHFGAPHQRLRVFVLAYSKCNGGGPGHESTGRTERTGTLGSGNRPGLEYAPNDNRRSGPEKQSSKTRKRRGRSIDSDSGLADADVQGQPNGLRDLETTADVDGVERTDRVLADTQELLGKAIERDEQDRDCLPLFPPGPAERDRWEEIAQRFPDLEPAIHGMAYGYPFLVDRLRCIGNATVPLVVAYAFDFLCREAGINFMEIDEREVGS